MLLASWGGQIGFVDDAGHSLPDEWTQMLVDAARAGSAVLEAVQMGSGQPACLRKDEKALTVLRAGLRHR